ncbi:MAG: HAD family hydrolase [Desulfobaccales bacterium]
MEAVQLQKIRKIRKPDGENRQPSLIIYDCDGVLIDSRRANHAFYNHILAHFGRPPLTSEQLDLVHAATAQEAIDFLFPDAAWRAQAQDYQRHLDNGPFLSLIGLEPHVREVLAQLRSAAHLAVASNRGKSLVQVLRTLGLDGFFEMTVGSSEVSRPKPHPECLRKILAHFRVEPEEALYIGDSEVDQLLTEAAGVPLAAYKNPSLQGRYHLRDHLELLPLLGCPPPKD